MSAIQYSAWKANLLKVKKYVDDKNNIDASLVKELYLTLVAKHDSSNEFKPTWKITSRNEILAEIIKGMPICPKIGDTYDLRINGTNPMRAIICNIDKQWKTMIIKQINLHTCCGKNEKPVGQLEHHWRYVKIVWR